MQWFDGGSLKLVKALTDEEFYHVQAICVTVKTSERKWVMLLLPQCARMRMGEITSLNSVDVLDCSLAPPTRSLRMRKVVLYRSILCTGLVLGAMWEQDSLGLNACR